MRARFVHLKTPRLVLLATLLALTVAASMTFIAAGQEQPATYYACLKNGSLSNVDTSAPSDCPGKGTTISWNQLGPAGPQGETGPAGPAGATGPQGPAGATGATGPAGPQGPTGATGPEGPAGASGVSGYEIVTVSTTPSVGATTQAMTASCPAGKQAVAGGGQPVFDSGISGYFDLIALHASRPTFDGKGWNVQAVDPNVNQGTGWHLTVYAVCAAVGP
jgi:hypothetical protein